MFKPSQVPTILILLLSIPADLYQFVMWSRINRKNTIISTGDLLLDEVSTAKWTLLINY